MLTRTQQNIWTLVAMGMLSLTACESSDPSGETGYLSLGVSDGPMNDATKVCIAFDEVELKGQGAPFIVDPGGVQNINLLDFQGANAAPLLFNEEVPAGEYQWLRLGVNAVRGNMGGLGPEPDPNMCAGDNSYVVFDDGNAYGVYIPSGDESGLKFINGFTVPANRTAELTAEFDLMLSIKERNGSDPDIKMRPTVKLVNNFEVGTLTGEIVPGDLDEAFQCDPLTASVYVFDDGVAPNAIDAGDVPGDDDPIATAMVEERMNGDGSTSYHYTVGFLLAGSYEVAYTCDGENFLPIDGEDLLPTDSKPAEIVPQEVETVDFP